MQQIPVERLCQISLQRLYQVISKQTGKKVFTFALPRWHNLCTTSQWVGCLRDSRRGNDCDGWRALSQLCDQVHFEFEFVEVVTVADVDDEDHVGNSLLQVCELRFCHKAKLLFRLSA